MGNGMVGDWGAEIRRLRQARYLKQAALAELLNVNQATVSRWERNAMVPELGMQRRLRDMMRRPGANDALLRHSIAVAQGQVILSNVDRIMQSISRPYSDAHGLPHDAMLGQSTSGMYTHEGEVLWQEARRAGFYRGDVASVTAICRANALSGRRRNLPVKVVWTPARLASGEVFLRGDRAVLSEPEFAAQLAGNGGPLRIVHLDDLAR